VLANLCGQFDEHLRQIEKRPGVRISNRGNHFRVVGTQSASARGDRVLQELYVMAGQENLDSQRVHMCLQETTMNDEVTDRSIDVGAEPDQSAGGDEQIIATRRVRIQPRGRNQKSYVANLRS